LPTGLYILILLISFLFLMIAWRKIISGSTGLIFAIFAPNDRYLFEYDRPGPLFWFLKGRCRGNQLKLKNRCFKSIDRMNFSTLYTVLVTFSPENPQFTLLTIAPFEAVRQKSAYDAKYLRISWTYLDLLYRFYRRIRGDNYPNIHLVLTQGTLSWQPVKFGRCLQMTPGKTFTRCSGVQEWIGRS